MNTAIVEHTYRINENHWAFIILSTVCACRCEVLKEKIDVPSSFYPAWGAQAKFFGKKGEKCLWTGFAWCCRVQMEPLTKFALSSASLQHSSSESS